MFFYNKKSVRLEHSFFKRLFCCVLVLLSSRGLAADCPILQLQQNRSLGAAITHNKCSSANDLALESVIELQAGTRIWLESVDKLKNGESFQVICLNKSSVAQKLKITRADLPWLSSLNPQDCAAWSANRLVCKHPDKQHEILLCAITPKHSPGNIRTVQSKTSVTVRGIGKLRQAQEPQNSLAGFVTPGINLCRKLLNNTQTITLNWTIDVAGTVSKAAIVEANIDQQFAACALEALEQVAFPPVNHETRLTISF
jgi:hypothetical protein